MEAELVSPALRAVDGRETMSAVGPTSVSLVEMRSQVLECGEGLRAQKALVRCLLRMLAQMSSQMSLGSGHIITVRAFEWFLARVDSQMGRQ